MTSFNPTIKALFVVTVMLVVASAAQAQTRTWVSGVGDDLIPAAARPLAKRSRARSTRLLKTAKSVFSIQAGMAR